MALSDRFPKCRVLILKSSRGGFLQALSTDSADFKEEDNTAILLQQVRLTRSLLSTPLLKGPTWEGAGKEGEGRRRGSSLREGYKPRG